MRMPSKKIQLGITVLLIILLTLFLATNGCGRRVTDPAELPAGTSYSDQETLSGDEGSSPEEADASAEAGSETLAETTEETPTEASAEITVEEDGTYDSPEEVALYLHLFGHLPSNYITKSEARALGWEGGSVEEYQPGAAIGGSLFGNFEGLLPEAEYHECDVNTLGEDTRGPERLVYDDKGNIYYTKDHYKTFEQLY